jgi:rieske iron-sulfur protein
LRSEDPAEAHAFAADSSARDVERRSLLRACCALAVTRALRVRADESGAEPPPEAIAPPQPNDWLAYAFGARTGQPIALADLAPGAKQITAYPLDPATRRVRDGTRLNQLIVVRLAADALAEETRARAAEGVVAYSGVCTHTGCDVTDWLAPVQHFKCPCHESEYDPGDAARVISGPAPWQLAALPLKIADGLLTVAAPFVGKVGFAQPGSPAGE